MTPPPPAPPNDAPAGRRGFLRRVGAALGALVAAPAAWGLLAPLFGGAGGRWRKAAKTADVKPGAPARVLLDVAAGWETRKQACFLVEQEGGVVAFSATCTHAGCTVRFRDGEFRCPCHGGAFDLDGQPLRGPVDEPLRRLDVRVQGDDVEVRA